MADSESSYRRLVLLFCKKCRKKFEVTSPDNKHIFAAQTKAAFEIPSPLSDIGLSENQKTSDNDIIELEHECPNCKEKNKVFWGQPKIP